MGPEHEAAADPLNRAGEEPEAESGAGYGSHAPEPESEMKGDEAEKSA